MGDTIKVALQDAGVYSFSKWYKTVETEPGLAERYAQACRQGLEAVAADALADGSRQAFDRARLRIGRSKMLQRGNTRNGALHTVDRPTESVDNSKE